MERRAAERYYIHLPADVCHPAQREGKGTRVRIRDISSVGAAFRDSETLKVGEVVTLAVQVGDGIVGPFSYSLKARGKIVRKDGDVPDGGCVYAVSFDKGIRMSGWMEKEGTASDQERIE